MPLATALGKTEPIYLTAQIRLIERAALDDNPRIQLMERAGEAAANIARELLGENGTHVLVLAGSGNNAGDGFVVARLLKRLERLADLPPAEQRAVLKVLDGFLDSFSAAARPLRPKQKAS